MNFKLSFYTVCTDSISDNIDGTRLLYSTRTGVYLTINGLLWNQLNNGELDKIDLSTIDELLKHEMIVPEHQNEFEEIFNLNKLKVKENLGGYLSFTIQPTANCQLGCGYCGQVHQKHNTASDVQQKIIDRIKQKVLLIPDAKGVEITWYGGEPLLAYSQVKFLSNQIMDFCKEKKIRYNAHIITNGLSLKPEVFKELYFEHNVRYFQVTVDTTKEHHDKRRITKEGKSTYDIIMGNLKNIISMPEYKLIKDKPISIRMNIDQTNFNSVVPFIDELVSMKLQDKVSIAFAPIVNWGDNTAGDTIGISKEEYANLEIQWIYYAFQKGFIQNDLIPKRSYTPCMVVDENSEVYDAYGNIYPCYEFSYTPKYENDKYRIGNLKDSEDTFSQDVLTRNWYNSDVESGKYPCRNCNFFPVCGGGCPKKWLNGEPGCPQFKFNMKDRLVLDYVIRKSTKLN